MPSRFVENAWDVWFAEGKLDHLGREAIEQFVDRLGAAIESSRVHSHYSRKAGVVHSRYPGEDDGYDPPSRDITSYVFEHLLPYTLNISLGKERRRNEGLLGLIKELKPDEFAAVLLLYADRVGDTAAVRRAHELISRPARPSLEPLHVYRRRRAGGHGRRESLKEDLTQRNNDIREDYKRLLASGRSKREIPGIIAKTRRLSEKQIRRIVNETDTS